MARFNPSQAAAYSTGGNFLSLKNHGDSATVRFLYSDPSQLELTSTHEIEVGGRRRRIDCLWQEGMSRDVCPLCMAGYTRQNRAFIPVYNETAQASQVWERGNPDLTELEFWAATYPNLVSVPFTIQRIGAKGDNGTKYMKAPLSQPDGMTIDNYEMPEIFAPNGICMTRTAEEMNIFIQTGNFPAPGGTTPASVAPPGYTPRPMPANPPYNPAVATAPASPYIPPVAAPAQPTPPPSPYPPATPTAPPVSPYPPTSVSAPPWVPTPPVATSPAQAPDATPTATPPAAASQPVMGVAPAAPAPNKF